MLYLLSFLLCATQLQIASAETNQTSTNTNKKRAVLYPSGTLDLPEIIINKAATNYFSGYHYPIPTPPFQFDEPTAPVLPSYLESTPPLIDPAYLPPLNGLAPPYAEPPNHSSEYLPPSTTANMSCLETGTNQFFRATVRLNANAPVLPVIDGATVDDCLGNHGEYFQLDLMGSKMAACGVRHCADRDLCVKVRVPMVPGLRLLEDQQILLQCRLQDPVLANTKRFRMGPVRMLQGRALGGSTSVTGGGSRRSFDMEVTLYRRNSNEPVSAGSAIYLGDELLLRAAVRDGDGWRYGRLSTVTIHPGAPTAVTPVQQSVTLLDERGCRVEAMRAVCPEQPRQLGPLTVSLPFRAFLFQHIHQKEGLGRGKQEEEMVLSVRMVACLDAHDCAVQTCSQVNSRGRTRAKRHNNNGGPNKSASSTDIETYLDFRVTMRGSTEDDYAKLAGNAGKLIDPATVLAVSVISLLAALAALVYLKNRMKPSRKHNNFG